MGEIPEGFMIDELTGKLVRLEGATANVLSPLDKAIIAIEAFVTAITPIQKIIKQTGDAMSVFKNNKPVFDTIGSSKFKKGVNAFKGGIFSMMQSVGPMAILSVIMEGLMVALDPFMIILELIGGLFEIMGANILPPLMLALQPVMDLLLELSPIFAILGTIIGIMMQVGMIPLTIIFELLGALLIPLMPLLDPFLGFLKELSPMISILSDILSGYLMEAIMWLVDFFINNFNPTLKAVLWVFEMIWAGIEIVWNALAWAWEYILKPIFDGIGIVFDWIVDIITGFLNGIIAVVNGFIWVINLIPGVDIDELEYLAEGGVVDGPMLAILGDNPSGKEAVVPLEKADQMGFGGGDNEELVFEMQQNTERLDILIQMKENKRKWEF